MATTNTINVRYKTPSKSTSDWSSTTKIPLAGEIIYDSTANKLKIGDGVTTAANLPYLYDPADSATKLATARTLWGQSFDGTANVSGDMTSVGSIESNNYHNITKSGAGGYYNVTGSTYEVFFGIGSGNTNRGIYETSPANKWLLKFDASNTTLNYGDVLPGTNASQNLGTSSLNWKTVYANQFNYGTTAWAVYSASGTGYTGFPSSGTYHLFGGVAYGTILRTLGDDLIHYNHTDNKRYKVLDEGNAFVSDVHNATDTNKAVPADQVWAECDKRNVSFEEKGDYDVIINTMTEEEWMQIYSYGIGWTQNTNTCEWVGSESLVKAMPVQNSLRAGVNELIDDDITVEENGYSITYGGQRKFRYWLDPDDWSKKADGTASDVNLTNASLSNHRLNISIYNSEFYYKSFKLVASSTDHTNTGTWNEVRLALTPYDNTWNRFKAGGTDFAKAQRVSWNSVYRLRSWGVCDFSIDNPRDSQMTRADFNAWNDNVTASLISTNRATAHTYAKNAGGHLLSFEEYQILFYWLPAIEFKTFAIESNVQNYTWSEDVYTVSRESVLDTIGAIGYPMLYAAYNNSSGFNYVPAGYTNDLASHTGWVRMCYPNSSDAAWEEQPVVRYRGFELQRNIWTNCYGGWGMAVSASQCEIFMTKNRALWNNAIPIKTLGYEGDASDLAANAFISEWSTGSYEVINADIQWKGTQTGSSSTVYSKDFILNTTCDLIPETTQSAISGSKGDRSYTYGSVTSSAYNNPRSLIFGGAVTAGAVGGPGYLLSYHVASIASGRIGFRVRFNNDEYNSIYN